jgi:dihydrolipoyl dehydrogenase
MADRYDVAVLGGGTGGYSAAIRAASLGLNTVLVERDLLGGTCLHRGCIPTKALLHSAEVYDGARDAKRFGVLTEGVSYDWDGVQSFKAKVVDRMFKGLQGLLKHKKVEVLKGMGTLRGPKSLAVDSKQIETGSIVIATGSAPKMIPGLSIGPRVITSDEALKLADVPSSAIVLGGGSVGVEFASVWASFGAKVTIVEMLPSLVPLEDADCGKELERSFKKRGIVSMTGAKLEEAIPGEKSVVCRVTTNGKTETLEADLLLVAVGRGPVTEGAGLEAAGVKTDRGFVKVNETCETNVSGVYAVGDVINTPALAHVSFAEGVLAAEKIAGESPPGLDYNAIPRCTYSVPEVAAVGLTEAQARERGHEVVTKTTSFSAIGKAHILGEGAGFCKIVADDGGAILGVHMVGPRVTDLVAEAMLAVGWEALPEEVAQLIHPHPTLAEAFGETALALAGKALHT